MSRSIVTNAVILVLLATSAVAAQAQQAPAMSERADVSLNPPVLFHAVDAPGRTQSGVASRFGRMFAGAVVGGWFGYFASQLAVSDWDAASNPSIATNRGAWAAAGVLSGAVAGRLLNPGAQVSGVPIDMTRGRALLDRQTIVASGATNAYDLIRSLRAEWLQPRGVNSFTETARGYADDRPGSVPVVVAGEDHVLVYLDNAHIGGTQHLNDLPLADVSRIEFIPGPQATFRWGAGHAHGVILITTHNAAGR